MQCIINFLNDNEGALMVIITAVYVVATIFICIFNQKSVTASKEQLIQQERISRATFVKEIYMKLYSDIPLREFFYSIEWSEYKPRAKVGYVETKDEQCADELLSLFDMACRMYYQTILHEEDMAVLEYEMLRFYEHPDTQSYLNFLSNWQNKQKIGKSYESYKKYCEEKYSASIWSTSDA